MRRKDVLEDLRKQFPFYLMGKRSNTIKAAIYYLENDNVTYRDVSKKFGCSDAMLEQRVREIRKLLSLPKKPIRVERCFLCGSRFSRSQKHFNIIDSEGKKLVGRLCINCFKKEIDKTIKR
jgi:hypothetical protein